MHKHIGNELICLEICCTGKMQPQQSDQIDAHLGQGKTGHPKQEVDDNEIFRYWRNAFKKARIALIHHIFLLFMDKGKYILEVFGVFETKT